MNIKPLYDFLLVKKDEVSETSKSGIYTPSIASDTPNQGTIVSMGEGGLMPDGTITESQLKVGDRVVFNQFAGSEVVLDEIKYTIMREKDVFGVIHSKQIS